MTFARLKSIFDHECRHHPDLLERYVIAIADAESEEEQQAVMRVGLAATVKERYAMPRAASA